MKTMLDNKSSSFQLKLSPDEEVLFEKLQEMKEDDFSDYEKKPVKKGYKQNLQYNFKIGAKSEEENIQKSVLMINQDKATEKKKTE